jgi:hypothetical protein
MMIPLQLTLLWLTQVQPRIDIEARHLSNPIYSEAIRSGWSAAGSKVEFPSPILKDGLPAQAQREAILNLAGSEEALANLLRDSVTAPFILKVHDQKATEATVRIVDLWFAVHADLEGFDPLDVARRTSGKAAEAGNMRFESRLLTEDEMKGVGKASREGRELSRWYSLLKSRLLDRIAVQAVDEAVATRTDESLVIAACTDPLFDREGPLANRWQTLREDDSSSQAKKYAGGMSYAKVSRLRQPEGVLLIEFHGAFSEPDAWFQGAPILRSKVAPVAQDQIRRLRRALLKDRSKQSRPKPASP